MEPETEKNFIPGKRTKIFSFQINTKNIHSVLRNMNHCIEFAVNDVKYDNKTISVHHLLLKRIKYQVATFSVIMFSFN